VPWHIFEREASTYEEWYTTRRGRRVDRAERALLKWLLAPFPTARSALEVGCGTGHFTEWLTRNRLSVVGLDRAPAMLAEMRRRFPEIPAILGDAHRLPFREGAVDLVVFVTTLEFLEEPEVALAEEVLVACQGLMVVTLNRWSLGGLSRRRGSQAGRPLLSQARDVSPASLQGMLSRVAGERLQEVRWTSTLFPDGLWWIRAPIPLGDVIGMAAVLTPPATSTPGAVRG